MTAPQKTSTRYTHLGPSVLLAAFLMTGCAAPRELQVGIYSAPPPAFSELKASGFDFVLGSSTAETLNQAHQHGLKIIPALGLMTRPEPPSISLLEQIDRHPATLAWYLADEPDLTGISPATVQRKKRWLRQHTRKPTLMVVASGSAVEKFAPSTDWIALDWYPIPWAPLATLHRELRLARLARQGKPLFAVLQAFDWAAFPELLRTDVELRPPSYEELRCMAYLALFHEVHGIIFYSYKAGSWRLPDHPELWAAVKKVASEVKQDSPLLASRLRWWPQQTRYETFPEGMYNQIHEGAIALGMFKAQKSSAGSDFYFLAINTTEREIEFAFKLPAQVQTLEQKPIGGELHALEDGWVRKIYQPFEVVLFGPIQVPNRSDW